ncbi:MAG: caspase family protein [Pseudomonadota bacterium]
MRVLAGCLALGLAATTVLPAFAATRTFGLVIGIDNYDHISDLDGAVNDALDIADALTGIGAEVTVLLNHDASRDAILSNWRSLADKVGPGDRLVVSYAGHGSNEPEHYPGNEDDGRDETLILSGFSPYGADAGERIRDDEIAELIALTPDTQIIIVADACHSGTLSRNVRPILGYRYVSPTEMENDPLPPPPPATPASDGREDVALFLAAVDDANKVPEFLIDGKPRGALSYSFASGIRGGADADGNGDITKAEIEEYVRRKVRDVSQGIQTPQVSPSGRVDSVLFALGSGDTPQTVPVIIPGPGDDLPTTTAQPGDAFDALPPIVLAHDGGAPAEALLRDLDGVRLIDAPANADLVLSLRDGTIRSMVGDVIREIGPQAPVAFFDAVQATTDKARVTRALRQIASDSAFEVGFTDGDKTYRGGDIVTVEVMGRQTQHVALMNIASTGEVAYLYPVSDPSLGINDPATLPPANPLALPLRVGAPYGADHILAFETEGPAADLITALQAADGSTDLRALWATLSAALAEPDAPRVAVFPFHSAAR